MGSLLSRLPQPQTKNSFSHGPGRLDVMPIIKNADRWASAWQRAKSTCCIELIVNDKVFKKALTCHSPRQELTDADYEIQVKRSAQYDIRKTDRGDENTQNSLLYSMRATHAEAHTNTDATERLLICCAITL